jgi:rhamnosyltransferase
MSKGLGSGIPSRSDVSAVVVFFRPQEGSLQNLRALTAQFCRVIVVDNTPGPSGSSIRLDSQKYQGVTKLALGKNRGIAAALNIGIQTALREGSNWIFTFDQDSRIQDGYVESMLATCAQAERKLRVGMVAPQYQDPALGTFIPLVKSHAGNILECMTSGTMARAEVYRSIGPFEEDLFIDYVDIEYCLRARSRGFAIVQSSAAVLTHSLGQLRVRKFLGKELFITNHSPKRRYYIQRNLVVLLKRYFRTDPEWSLLKLKTLILDTFQVLIFEDQKLAKAGYMARALFDGLFNRLGQRVPL